MIMGIIAVFCGGNKIFGVMRESNFLKDLDYFVIIFFANHSFYPVRDS